MATKDFLFDISSIDLNHVTADLEVIRQFNPQRHEMEQLTAIVFEDTQYHRCIGYKDTSDRDFWVRGHMPGLPLMPGVIMCEAAAQLASYYTQKHDLLGSEMVGFGGLEDVRFRDPVVPGDRLYVVIELVKARRNRMIICRFQGFVKDRVVFNGSLKGIPLPIAALQQAVKRDDG
ncbi:MAG: beta-hydroxyacyl-ACP dehydratase [Planctomycetaceae bacterium]|nr:beta-hydroxyacyl-ACP dehydratase [Planctomycetaceae bacterium]